MTISPNLNNLLTNLDLPRQCTLCKNIYNDVKNNFYKSKDSKYGYGHNCKKCKIKFNVLYANTERGYLTNSFNALTKKIRSPRHSHLSNKDKKIYKCYITKEEFFELWEEHKKKFGYHCQLTGAKMILKRAPYSKERRYQGYSNGMSTDRLNPKIGYTKKNIIFVTNQVNKMKSAITKQLCISILKVYKERNL